jgi:hypothetical protein
MDNKDVATRWFNKGNNDLIAGNHILAIKNANKIRDFILNKLKLS